MMSETMMRKLRTEEIAAERLQQEVRSQQDSTAKALAAACKLAQSREAVLREEVGVESGRFEALQREVPKAILQSEAQLEFSRQEASAGLQRLLGEMQDAQLRHQRDLALQQDAAKAREASLGLQVEELLEKLRDQQENNLLAEGTMKAINEKLRVQVAMLEKRCEENAAQALQAQQALAQETQRRLATAQAARPLSRDLTAQLLHHNRDLKDRGHLLLQEQARRLSNASTLAETAALLDQCASEDHDAPHADGAAGRRTLLSSASAAAASSRRW